MQEGAVVTELFVGGAQCTRFHILQEKLRICFYFCVLKVHQ